MNKCSDCLHFCRVIYPEPEDDATAFWCNMLEDYIALPDSDTDCSWYKEDDR